MIFFGQVNVCDTCGVQGFTNKLAICDSCGVGAEHTYCCMVVELEDVPKRLSCNDCVEMGEGGFRKQNDISTQKSSVTVSLDLNIEPNLNLNPNIDLNLDPSIDLNVNPYLYLNLDMNLDPNLDLSVDNNLDLSLDCGSYYHSSSTSNFQAHTRREHLRILCLGKGPLRRLLCKETSCGYTTLSIKWI
ncbi:hypothetical protein DY000_02005845 [Brassica cretica]|uniref:Zinc finger PHD-type domain-containing protein n=1 Tax=Brassica cretica TaxID=69181 RepID=A0ABQ7C1F6_BRACR|nr:hypothetical protein DY000_02005845 [Brassica cretica]